MGVVNSTSSLVIDSQCGITDTQYNYTVSPSDTVCDGAYTFTVTPVNIVGNGTTSAGVTCLSDDLDDITAPRGIDRNIIISKT